MSLVLEDLHVAVGEKEVIKGVSLTFEKGKVHALMGPNGCGKSTLAKAIMGHPHVRVVSGRILLDGEDITTLPADVRAAKGLFLSFQHPLEIEGVKISQFMRMAVNKVKQKNYSVVEFHKMLRAKMASLGIDKSFASRSLNKGYSGGEKKRMEMLQMALLEPSYALLDETDSGLDVDAIHEVARAIVTARDSGMGAIVITHYNRFLEFLEPDEVSVMRDGKVVARGGRELAEKIEKNGFGDLQ